MTKGLLSDKLTHYPVERSLRIPREFELLLLACDDDLQPPLAGPILRLYVSLPLGRPPVS